MENSTNSNPSALPPSEFYWVSFSTICLLYSCSQNLVSAYDARQSALRHFRGGIPPPEPPRIPLGLNFNQSGTSTRTPPRHSVEYANNPRSSTESPAWYPRHVGPCTPNCCRFIRPNLTTPSTSDSDIYPVQLVSHTTEGLRLWAETVGFHPIGKHLLRDRRLSRVQHERCTPGAFYRS